MLNDVFLGRQPILDSDNKIFGYEILFRSNEENVCTESDNIRATSHILTILFNNIDFKSLTGNKLGFINVDNNLLESDILSLIPPQKFIIEVLETVVPSKKVIERIWYLKEKGYKFALDDYFCDPNNFKIYEDYFPLFDIIKFDIADVNHHEKEMFKKIDYFQKLDSLLLAEKVENEEDFEKYKSMGFDLFQGYFFSKPVVSKQKMLNPDRFTIISILNLIDNNAEISEIVELIKQEPKLTINLLKLMNSAYFSFRQEISSVKHAVALLGMKNLKRWLILMLYSGLEEDISSNPILMLAKNRADLMSLLAKKIKIDEEIAYLTGLLSLIDVIFEVPIDEIFKSMRISKEIKDAIMYRYNIYGKLLNFIIAQEAGDNSMLYKYLNEFNMNVSEFNQIIINSYAKSIRF
ncbi:EAL and HDOD domain-containing protein [Nitrosophilus kaiyonis]|uniref:EAL and HDOD domain-containing protein n=1 Tax=Nitrosophilus kaiyonis TaxID=2930200 RepID=UPI00249121BD|nr:HDOD domain-containing protein [Nitrosophilus kaiyonis]